MKTIEGIILKFHCDENLDKMPECSSGKYCTKCSKNVIDFRKSDRIYLLKALNENSEVCGIFSKEQINLVPKISEYKLNVFKRYAIGVLVYFGINTFNKEALAQNNSQDTSKNTNNKNEYAVFGGVSEVLPEYKGGNQALAKFIKNNINYPGDAKEGKVFLSFIIDTLGKVTSPKIVRSLNQVADKEALRIVKLLTFYPGIQNGKPKSYEYTLPIFFNTEK